MDSLLAYRLVIEATMKLLFLFKSDRALFHDSLDKLIGMLAEPRVEKRNEENYSVEVECDTIANPEVVTVQFEWEYVNVNEREHTRPNAADVGPVGI